MAFKNKCAENGQLNLSKEHLDLLSKFI